MHNEEPEIGKIAKQSPSSRNSLAILEKVLNETTTPTTTTASTSTTELASTAITEQDLREEASEGPPEEIKEDSSNNRKLFKIEILGGGSTALLGDATMQTP